MEFVIFLNGYPPGPAAHDSAHEHGMPRCEIEGTIAADRSIPVRPTTAPVR
jgi:hypothetical protein